MIRVLGTDTSHWAGKINFDTMYNAGARFWYTKATDANKYTGLQFEDSKLLEYSEAVFEQGKLLAGCYHWLQASVDTKVAAKFYLERYKRFPYHFPPILDFEETEIIRTKKFSDYAWKGQVFLGEVGNATGRTPMIYTAKWYMDYFDEKYVSWMKDYPGIIADYTCWSNELKTLLCENPRRKPAPWLDNWSIWQFSADGNRRGKEFGVSAGDIDLNYWHADMDSLLAFLGLDTAPKPDPITNEPFINGVFRVIGKEQNVRSEPVVNSTNVVKVVQRDTEIYPIQDIKVYDENNVWLKYPAGWIVLIYQGNLYLKQERI